MDRLVVIWAHRHQRKTPSAWIPENELFIDLVRQVLREWGMDSRAAKWVTPTEFRRAVRELTSSPVILTMSGHTSGKLFASNVHAVSASEDLQRLAPRKPATCEVYVSIAS